MAETNRTPLVDVHAHFLTDKYVQAAKDAGIMQPDGVMGWPTWNADQHVELMDQWGVSTSILSISSPGVWFGDADQLTMLARKPGAPTPTGSDSSPPCRCRTSTRHSRS
jgi:hypothetical protein